MEYLQVSKSMANLEFYAENASRYHHHQNVDLLMACHSLMKRVILGLLKAHTTNAMRKGDRKFTLQLENCHVYVIWNFDWKLQQQLLDSSDIDSHHFCVTLKAFFFQEDPHAREG